MVRKNEVRVLDRYEGENYTCLTVHGQANGILFMRVPRILSAVEENSLQTLLEDAHIEVDLAPTRRMAQL